jgi:hypothetical protein
LLTAIWQEIDRLLISNFLWHSKSLLDFGSRLTLATHWSGGRAHPGLSKGQRHDHVDHRITTSTKSRPFAGAAIFVAAMSVAAATAPTADARPKSWGDQYSQCVVDAVKYRQAHGYDLNMNEIQGGCCGSIGGTIVTGDDGVTFKDCIFPTEPPAAQTTPPPGGTAILHPGDTTRAGDQ